MPPSRKSNNSNNNCDSDIMNEINQQLTEADEYVAKKMKRNDNSSIDSSEVPDVITDEMLSEINDQQSIDESTAKKLDEEAKQSYLENDVFDAIVQFMKTDDIIKEKETMHREEVAPLKKHRTDLEMFLIDYLDKIDQEFIKVGEKTQLTKVESTSKGPIKPENVAEALLEGFKKHELYTEDQHDEMVRVIKDMIQIVESKREQKVKKKIARVNLEKQAKKDAETASKANADKINKKVKQTNAKSKPRSMQKAKGAKPKAKATKTQKVIKSKK